MSNDKSDFRYWYFLLAFMVLSPLFIAVIVPVCCWLMIVIFDALMGAK